MNEITPANRRVFLKSVAAGTAGVAAGRVLGADDVGQGAGGEDTGADLARPLEKQVAWQDCEVGVIYRKDLRPTTTTVIADTVTTLPAGSPSTAPDQTTTTSLQP